MDNVGELLIKMFMLCKEHDVSIRVGIASRDAFGPNAFTIQLERDQICTGKVIDTTMTYMDPVYTVEQVFHRALYDLNYVSKES